MNTTSNNFKFMNSPYYYFYDNNKYIFTSMMMTILSSNSIIYTTQLFCRNKITGSSELSVAYKYVVQCSRQNHYIVDDVGDGKKGRHISERARNLTFFCTDFHQSQTSLSTQPPFKKCSLSYLITANFEIFGFAFLGLHLPLTRNSNSLKAIN